MSITPFTIQNPDSRNPAAVAAWALERVLAWEKERARLENSRTADDFDRGFAAGKARSFRETVEVVMGRGSAENLPGSRHELAQRIHELCQSLTPHQLMAIGL